MEDVVTGDWSQFGLIEIEEAKELLSHIKEIDSYGKVEVQFNRNSGCVFLVDENYRCWMMKEVGIEEWFSCPYCGHEGFFEDMNHDFNDNGCLEYLKQIGVIDDE